MRSSALLTLALVADIAALAHDTATRLMLRLVTG